MSETRAWDGETMLPCPFCGGTVDPEGWLGSEEDPETGDALVRGPECNECGATARDMTLWNCRVPCVPPAAPGADEVEVVARAMWEDMFAPHELPLDDWLQDRYRHTAKCALAALAPQRQAEHERARADAIEEAARWHDVRAESASVPLHPDADPTFRLIAAHHRMSAAAIRSLAPAPAAEGERR